jgi:hypothetical protein
MKGLTNERWNLRTQNREAAPFKKPPHRLKGWERILPQPHPVGFASIARGTSAARVATLDYSAFLGTTAFPAPSRKVLAVLASGSLSALLTNASRTDQPRHGMHRAIRLFAHNLFLPQKASCQATRWLFSSSATLLPPVRQLVFVSFRGCQSSTGRNASGTDQSCT